MIQVIGMKLNLLELLTKNTQRKIVILHSKNRKKNIYNDRQTDDSKNYGCYQDRRGGI